jgi:hypothetical protein
MNPSRSNRQTRKPTFAPERLEDRQMLTGGVGSTFAILPATISKAGGTVSVSFNLQPSLFTDPGNKAFKLGIDVAANTNSTANPEVTSVLTPTGKSLSVSHAKFDPKVTRTGAQAASKLSTAAIVTIPGLPAKGATGKAVTYKVNVTGLAKTSGTILVGLYLPGDADGNGTVQQADLNAIKYATNVTASNSKYSFDADVDRNGIINAQDLAIAKSNLGVGTTVSPVISANVTPAQMVDPTNRITNLSSVTITGAATPNSSISYSETGEPAVSTTATSTGSYSVTIPLLTGVNTYNVTTTDGFGQTITGAINSITYTPGATAPTTATSTTTTTTTSTTPTSTSGTSTTTTSGTSPTTTTSTTPTTTSSTSTTTTSG